MSVLHAAAALGIVVLTAVGMEAVATLLHRHWMHGPGWRLHRSHHLPGRRVVEANDLHAIVFAIVATLLCAVGQGPWWPLFWIGIGMMVYGALYALVHDGLVHRRFALPWRPRGAYVERLVKAHRLHHSVSTREGSVAHGFLLAPSVQRLQRWRRERVEAARGR